jgi:hypothetical protein
MLQLCTKKLWYLISNALPPPKKKVMLKLADQFCGEGGYFSQRTANQLVIFVRLDRQGGVRHMEVTGINGLEYGIFC